MSPLREVIFMNQAWAEAMIPDGSEAIISITDHLAPSADLNDGWSGLLRIQFDDVDIDAYQVGEFEEGLTPLSEAQAMQIVTFVQQLSQETKTLVVHCKYGQSRSPGVAKAICQHLGLRFPPKFKSQNNFVCRLVLEALSRHGGA